MDQKIELPALPDPVIVIKGTITHPDGTVVPFQINTGDKDGSDPSNSK